MGVWSDSAGHARRRYARAFRRLTRPMTAVEAEARHLHEVELAGESGETPYIVMLGLVLFLAPIFIVFLAIVLALYFFV
jgi:hypothetical protein